MEKTDDADKKTAPAKRRVGDGTPGPGRPKGAKNKRSAAMEDAIIKAIKLAGDRVPGPIKGSVGYFAHWANEKPELMHGLVKEMLPKVVEGSGDDGEFLIHHITREIVRAKNQDG